MSEPPGPASSRALFESHPRSFRDNRYVYPVVSRRSGGISIGVNLSPHQRCNFDCIYCQVDRSGAAERSGTPKRQPVDVDRLAAELDAMVRLVISGGLYEHGTFRATRAPMRRLNDIALSGDGEPTLAADFVEVVAACAEVRRRHALDDVKLVLITNASLLHQDRVRRGLEILDRNGGEVWAKLDAGSEEHFRRVARSAVPFPRILRNLRDAAKARPIVIQSLFARIRGEPPSEAEQEAYCRRLCEIVEAGGRIKLVQLCTLARPPREGWVSPLSDRELDALAGRVRRRTGLPAATFYG
jgi:wyosine [tRNA(Phe)-imidazoG37] synthetase (radical SAM superfamily)